MARTICNISFVLCTNMLNNANGDPSVCFACSLCLKIKVAELTDLFTFKEYFNIYISEWYKIISNLKQNKN